MSRNALLPAYLKFVMEEQKEAAKKQNMLPSPPPYDPSVATAIFE